MEEKKRKGYKTQTQQYEAEKRWLENNPEAREKKRLNSLKSSAKRFIKDFATLEELEEIEKLIKDRKDEFLISKKNDKVK